MDKTSKNNPKNDLSLIQFKVNKILLEKEETTNANERWVSIHTSWNNVEKRNQLVALMIAFFCAFRSNYLTIWWK